MKRGFDSLRGVRFGIGVKGLMFNRSSATTLTSYRPSGTRAKPSASREKLALIIPALHEAGNLRALLMRVRTALDHLEIPWEAIVVDDDSRDGTVQTVGAFTREDPRVRLLVRRGERGLSGAVLHGWRHTDASILGVMDADGQHPPEILPELLSSILEGRDLAVGSRFARGGRGGWNPVRRIISRAAIMAARPLQPQWLPLNDLLSGYFLVRRHCVENIPFQTAGFKLLLEILVRARIGSAVETPLTFGKRRAGRSKMSAKVAWDYLALLARLYRARFALPRIPQAASGD